MALTVFFGRPSGILMGCNDDQREQSYSERQLYEAALDRLTREVAAVSGVDEAGAAKKVDDVLVSRAA